MLDFTKAPPGIKEYASLVRNLTNEQLFERIGEWPNRGEIRKEIGNTINVECFVWTVRVEIEELRRRLGTWFALEHVAPAKYSGTHPILLKCGIDMNSTGHIETWLCKFRSYQCSEINLGTNNLASSETWLESMDDFPRSTLLSFVVAN